MKRTSKATKTSNKLANSLRNVVWPPAGHAEEGIKLIDHLMSDDSPKADDIDPVEMEAMMAPSIESDMTDLPIATTNSSTVGVGVTRVLSTVSAEMLNVVDFKSMTKFREQCESATANNVVHDRNALISTKAKRWITAALERDTNFINEHCGGNYDTASVKAGWEAMADQPFFQLMLRKLNPQHKGGMRQTTDVLTP